MGFFIRAAVLAKAQRPRRRDATTAAQLDSQRPSVCLTV